MKNEMADKLNRETAGRIQALLGAKGMSQQELCNQLQLKGYTDVTKQKVSKILNGKTDMPAWFIYESAEILNISTDYLFYGEDELGERIQHLSRVVSSSSPETKQRLDNIFKILSDIL